MASCFRRESEFPAEGISLPNLNVVLNTVLRCAAPRWLESPSVAEARFVQPDSGGKGTAWRGSLPSCVWGVPRLPSVPMEGTLATAAIDATPARILPFAPASTPAAVPVLRDPCPRNPDRPDVPSPGAAPWRAIVQSPTLRCLLLAAGLAAFGGGSAASAASFVYDWSTASASGPGIVVEGNDGWTKLGGCGNCAGDTVRNTGQPDGFFTGSYYESVLTGESFPGDSIYTRPNDGSFSYSIPSGASSITLTFVTRHSGDIEPTTDIGNVFLTSSGSSVIRLGNGSAGWGFRNPGDTSSQAANGSGNLELDGTLRTWRVTGTLDMTPAGTEKTLDLRVENLSEGGSQLIFDDAPFELGAFADPSTWDGLRIRVNGIDNPANLDSIQVSFVPEPTTALLLAAALATLAIRRRRLP